jgi:hypothetical protein
MKSILKVLFIAFILKVSFIFSNPSISYAVKIDVTMRAQRSGIAYSVWIENPEENFKQHVYVCQKVNEDLKQETSDAPDIYSKGRLGGRALPYWRSYIVEHILWKDLSAQEQHEIDAVSGASIQGTHTFTFDIDNPPVRKFRLCFEVDKSWDFNDWFSYSPQVPGFVYDNTAGKTGNQPAVLFAVDIDLDNLPPNNTLTMTPIGWTPHEKNPAPGVLTKDDRFIFFSELRYVTHKKSGSSGFGNLDSQRATLIMEDEKIDVKIYWNCEGDFDADGDGDGADLADFAEAFGSSSGVPNYNPDADFSGDGMVDEDDLVIFAADFGRMDCP